MFEDGVDVASKQIVAYVLKAYKNERGVHSETTIGALAALLGDTALRSFEPHIPEKGWVYSKDTQDALIGGASGKPPALAIIFQAAIRLGVKAEDLPAMKEVAARVSDAIGSSPFPPLSVPDKHFPHEWSPNAPVKLREKTDQILEHHKLSPMGKVHAMAFAILSVMTMTRDVLDPKTAAILSAEIALGVSHMVPLQKELV